MNRKSFVEAINTYLSQRAVVSADENSGNDENRQESYMDQQKAIYPNAYSKWTEEEEERLLQLKAGGVSITEITEKLARNKGAIRSRLKKLAEEGRILDEKNEKKAEPEENIFDIYKPKGKISKIKDYAKSPYDYLLMMSIIDMMGVETPQSLISIDTLALLMIANAWETGQLYPSTIDGVPDIKKYIEFYIAGSKEFMDEPLDWNSPKELVFSQIKDYPIGDDIEDAIHNFVKEPLCLIDNVWIKADDMANLVELSKEFYNECLYGIHLREPDSFIEINPSWVSNLHKEHDLMLRYFRELYRNMLSDM